MNPNLGRWATLPAVDTLNLSMNEGAAADNIDFAIAYSGKSYF